jgi:CRP-like cAMP-binding protein
MTDEVHHVGAEQDPHDRTGGLRSPHPVQEPGTASLATVIGAGMWDALLADADIVHVSAGEPIYAAGQAPPVVAILSGRARVYIVAADGQQFTFRYAGGGEVIGLGPRLGGLTNSSAEALTDTTAATISLDRVRQLGFEQPALSWAIAEEMARWASNVVRTVAEAAHLPMTARVARHLLEISAPTPRGTGAGVTRQRLADAVGSAREVVTRTLGALRRARVVETSPGWVLITDERRLELIAHGDEALEGQS